MRGKAVTEGLQERRQSPRFPSEHLIAYTYWGSDRQPNEMGMAKTLDLSEGGVKIQIHRPFPKDANLQMFMAVEERLIEAIGLIVHQKELAEGHYELGASFIDIEERGRRFLASLM